MTATRSAQAADAEAPRARGPRKLRHIPALDGLRGVAVAGVLVYHGGHLQGGYLGVDLFFVLSGYLITSLLLHEWGGSGRINLGNFWSRRARRLFPALLAVLVVVAAYAWLVATPTDLGQIRGDGFATLFYVANWHSIFSGQSYFQASLAPSPLEHTWSLAIEEQFYLLWPLVVYGLLKVRNRPNTILRASLFLAGLSVATMVLLHHFTDVSANSLYLGTHTRVAAIAIGAALGAWTVGRRDEGVSATRRTALEAAGWVAVLFLAWMWSTATVEAGFVYSGGLALCGVAVVAVIAAATDPRPGLLSRGLSFPPLRWLGLISYGLYLWHWPIYLYLNEHRTGLSSWPLLALQAFVAIDVAVLSYFVLERPIRYGALKGRGLLVAAPAAIALVAVLLVMSTVGAVSGGDLDTAAADGSHVATGRQGSVKVQMFGDSVAYLLGTDGIEPRLDHFGISYASQIFFSCNPMRRFGDIRDQNGKLRVPPSSTDCTRSWRQGLGKERPDVAVLMLGGPPVYSVKINGAWREPCDAQYRTKFAQRFDEIAADLTSTGAPLVIVTNVDSTDSRLLATMPDDLSSRIACTNDTYREVAKRHPGVVIADLDGFICPAGRPCRQQVDGKPIRYDGIHFNHEGAVYVADWLMPKVLAAARKARPPGS